MTAYKNPTSSTTRTPVTNTTETSPTTGGLPKGLSIDTTKGTITGSIDTSVTPGEYKVSFYAFASPVATRRYCTPAMPSQQKLQCNTHPTHDCYLYHGHEEEI
ncbi:Ig domain-containing protein, partial [Tropheryma whipplei]|uniref:Ig domain-containing protein n=1 Tax=Tropheryma whipplei TaxID=2039 RepID=UPI003B97F3B6